MSTKRRWTRPTYLSTLTEEQIKQAFDSLDFLNFRTADLMEKLGISRVQALRLLRDEKYDHLRPALSLNIRRGRPFKRYPFIEEVDEQVLLSVCMDWMADMPLNQIAKKYQLERKEIHSFLEGKLRPDFQKPEGFIAPPRRRLSASRKEKTEKAKQAIADWKDGKISKRDLTDRLGVTRQAINYMLRGLTFPHLKSDVNGE